MAKSKVDRYVKVERHFKGIKPYFTINLFTENPDESDQIEKEKTMHEKMYQIATAKYNPFAIGGSENIGG